MATATDEQQPLCSPQQNAADQTTQDSGAAPSRDAETKPQKRVSTASALFGYTLMAGAALTQATRATLFHVSETVFHYPPSTALVLSAILFIVLSTSYCWFNNLLQTARLSRKQLVQLFFRGLCAAGTLYLNNIALSRIPVGTALTIFSTTPAITSVFAAVVLHDPLTLVDVLVLAVNLFGIVLVSRPSTPGVHVSALIGVAAAVGAALCAAVGFMLVKKMGLRVHFMLNMLSIGVGCCIICAAQTSWDQLQLLWKDTRATTIAFGGALAGFFTQALVNRGIQLCRPGPASVVRTFNVPISFLFGFLVLGETVSSTAAIGAILVLGSVAYIGFGQFVKQQRTAPARSQ